MKNQKKLYAILIGINAYKGCPPLTGCVNDILAVRNFLKKLCANEDASITFLPTYLLAPTDDEEEARIRENGIDQYKTPTRQNIIDAFQLFENADPDRGDFCLFYYSGHGSYMQAPAIFQECEPSGRLQTLVCVDSREMGQRDLLDKELGYLLAKSLEGKEAIREDSQKRPGVHLLAITDSCHSGTNTRGDAEDLVARMTTTGGQTFDENSILGFTRAGNCFYEKFEPGQGKVKRYGGLKHARYVKMSAAQDTEKAFEKTISIPQKAGEQPEQIRHGLFTYSLLATLNQSGTNISYGELIRRIQLEVNSRISGQVPLLDNTEVEDDDLLFLRNEFRSPRQEFEISFNSQKQEWILNAGAIQGIAPSIAGQKTLINVSGKTEPVEVKSVRAAESALDPDAFTEKDKENLRLGGTIAQMAYPMIPVGFGPDLQKDNPEIKILRQQISEAWKRHISDYLTWTGDDGHPDLEINLAGNKDGSQSFILTRTGSRVPLFERHGNASTFWGDVEKVARFENVLKMSNPDTEIPRDLFKVDVQVMEGVPFDAETLDKLFDAETLPKDNFRNYTDPDAVTVRYKKAGREYVQPAFKFKVEFTGYPNKAYWVGALYCDSQFGISSKLLPVQRMGKNGASELNLEFRMRENDPRKWDAIPVMVDPNWHRLGVTEITDYVVLFISDSERPFDLGKYNQEGIQLDVQRAMGFAPPVGVKKDDWFTIKIPINVSLPVSEVQVQGGSEIQFSGFKLKIPASLKALIQATNLASASRRMEQTRSVQSGEFDPNTMLPPGDLWTGLEDAEEIFTRCPVSEPDRHLSVLELTGVEGEVSEKTPLELFPDDALKPEETIIPFAYDAVNKVYYPIGFTDEKGTVCINRLPGETAGVIGADGMEATRDVGSSIKLFFRKVVWSKLSGIHDYHSLVLLKKNGDSIDRLEYRGLEKEKEGLEKIRAAVSGSSRVLLIIHGLIGDTKEMSEAVFHRTGLYQQFDAVLAFVYENLGTSNRDSAKALHDLLEKCEVPPKSLTVLAHSMGGLVSRWWIEQAGGAALVDKLIQVGTPNAGSELTDLRKKLINLLTLGINGWPALEPYKAILSFIGRGIDGSLFKTIQELQPDSAFFVDLNENGAQAPEGVQYLLIEGDTARIEAKFADDDPIWKKLYACLRDRSKYIAADYLFFDNDPNDMIVKTSSMRETPWPHSQSVSADSDHFSYFKQEPVLTVLIRLMEK